MEDKEIANFSLLNAVSLKRINNNPVNPRCTLGFPSCLINRVAEVDKEETPLLKNCQEAISHLPCQQFHGEESEDQETQTSAKKWTMERDVWNHMEESWRWFEKFYEVSCVYFPLFPQLIWELGLLFSIARLCGFPRVVNYEVFVSCNLTRITAGVHTHYHTHTRSQIMP